MPRAWISRPTPTPTRLGNNDLSAFIPPWAHDGGDAKLIERLKDPAVRARLKVELATAATDWDNEWQSVPGPEAILIATVLNPQLVDLQGRSLAEIAKARGTDPMDTLFDILVEDGARTTVAVFAMSESDIALAAVQPWVSFCNDSEGTSPEGLLGKEFPHPRAVRHLSTRAAQIRARGTTHAPRRGHSKIHESACLPSASQ